MLWDALTLQAGYNAALVCVGAALLGAAAGVTGSFLYLHKRSLVADAISHATLPGVALAFVVMVALGGDGRWLIGLMAGAAVAAVAGLLSVQWITRRTRLGEDVAIGAVLSTFFGLGVVLLTVVQSMDAGRQSGLEGFLLGAGAGMVRSEALTIAAGGALAVLLALLLARPMVLTAFDRGFAAAAGIRTERMDLAVMLLATAVTIVGLKVAGLVLVVALLIIPAVAARFWSDRVGRVVLLSGAMGGVAGYVGAAVSASAPGLPTGPLIVLSAAAAFVVSLLVAPQRGLVAAWLRRRRFHRRVHLRQGLIALAADQTVLEPYTRQLLRRAGLLRADGVATERGRRAAADVARDEARRRELRRRPMAERVGLGDDDLTPVEALLTPDEIAEIDARIFGPRGIEA